MPLILDLLTCSAADRLLCPHNTLHKFEKQKNRLVSICTAYKAEAWDAPGTMRSRSALHTGAPITPASMAAMAVHKSGLGAKIGFKHAAAGGWIRGVSYGSWLRRSGHEQQGPLDRASMAFASNLLPRGWCALRPCAATVHRGAVALTCCQHATVSHTMGSNTASVDFLTLLQSLKVSPVARNPTFTALRQKERRLVSC